MSITAEILSNLSARLGGELLEIGSRVTPAEMTLDGERYEAIDTITNAATPADFNRVVLWESGNGGMDTFSLLVILSDTDVLLELAADLSGTPNYATIPVEADVPMILPGGTLLGAVTVDGTETTMLAIEQIAVQNNNDDTSTATVRLLLLK